MFGLILQALKKGQSLLEADRVEACSFTADANGCTFYSGIVKAMMKRKVYLSDSDLSRGTMPK